MEGQECAQSETTLATEVIATPQDHDYLYTRREERVADTIDRMREICPEVNDIVLEYTVATEKACKRDRLEHKGQILTLDGLKDNRSLFQYYTD